MNILKYLALCFLATAFAFAQEQPVPVPLDSAVSSSSTPIALEIAPISSSSQVAISLPQPASSSSSVAEETKQPAPESKTIFDSLRGHAYNPYSTPGAASTVEDLITLPSDINGQKFFYISPTNLLGYTAFDIYGGSALLGLDRSGACPKTSNNCNEQAALVLGYANSIFGLALNYSIAKMWKTGLDGYGDSYDVRYTLPADNIGLYVSFPLSSKTLYANANWQTYDVSTDSVAANGDRIKYDYSNIIANIGLTGNAGSLAYDIYLEAIRDGGIITVYGDKLIDKNDQAYLEFALHFNLGKTVLQNSTARVIAGANSYFYIDIYDKTNNDKSDNVMGIKTIPTVLAEVFLSDNLLTFAGAVHALELIAGDADRNSETSLLEIGHYRQSGAFVGLRYQKTNWAMEAQLSSNMFNNPFAGFNGYSMFANFGGFIYF